MRLVARTVRLALRRPLRAAWGELQQRELVLVELHDDGLVGRGEAAPIEAYDGVSVPAVLAALDAHAAVLAAAGPGADHREVLDRCAAERDLPWALAAVDLALWDIEARRAGVPVARLLHPGAASAVPVNATITASDRAGAAAEAAEAVAAGFRALKVKVGVGDDAGRVAAVRAAVGPDVAIRVDANGAWGSVDEALANLRALAPAGIELCEEPVHGAEELRAVAEESPVLVAGDETWAPDLDAVCLKIGRCGGISGVLRAAAEARAFGAEVYVASAWDGPLGLAAGVHAAAALAAEGPQRACGLATGGIFEQLEDPIVVRGGCAQVPEGPGLL
jgi:L-alanine-DL-glutamate epimerase-like enolase superfamily enzyme